VWKEVKRKNALLLLRRQKEGRPKKDDREEEGKEAKIVFLWPSFLFPFFLILP